MAKYTISSSWDQSMYPYKIQEANIELRTLHGQEYQESDIVDLKVPKRSGPWQFSSITDTAAISSVASSAWFHGKRFHVGPCSRLVLTNMIKKCYPVAFASWITTNRLYDQDFEVHMYFESTSKPFVVKYDKRSELENLRLYALYQPIREIHFCNKSEHFPVTMHGLGYLYTTFLLPPVPLNVLFQDAADKQEIANAKDVGLVDAKHVKHDTSVVVKWIERYVEPNDRKHVTTAFENHDITTCSVIFKLKEEDLKTMFPLIGLRCRIEEAIDKGHGWKFDI